MPVKVTIAINAHIAETFHIARLTKNGLREESINEYGVIKQHDAPDEEAFMSAPRFEHRYGDNTGILTAKAILCYNAHDVSEAAPVKPVEVPVNKPTPLTVMEATRKAVDRLKASKS